MVFALLLLLLLCSVPASAQDRRVTYEGTPMAAVVRGDSIEIRYVNPPVNLRELGVTPDTLLVHGQWDAGIFTGEAFIFAPGCPPVPYPVRGTIDNSGALLVLGPAPTAIKDCKAESLAWNASSILRFELAGTAARTPERKSEAKPKPKPKPRPVERPQSRPQPRQPWENQWQWRW
jgi:hypothetical protein